MNHLNEDQKISLLTSYLSILPPRWSAQQNYIAMYFTIVLAVFGFAASQVTSLMSEGLQGLLSAPLLIAALISWFARRSITKQEKHIRELIVVTAKLEHNLGLFDSFKSAHPNQPWDGDEFALPTSWVSSRLSSGDKSNEFINQEIGGTSRIASNIFLVFMVLGIALATVAIFVQANVLPITP
ncbi:hypothetical protein [Hoeflea poritis]|uniref:SMODS and SLOG-associating 2TM effector domain-containing protein n=1 Tax=Hoeflea poritis TaxID=2993659 RepID=A0ABT4VW31_9HYPH|nr:hypothetical protein [Hoeflea poritis]MDA4848893.1 hypothetical protein [Hoeflea poritis]